MRKVLITGGFGFIGSNLVRYWAWKHPHDQIAILDSLTYAARPEWARQCGAALEHYCVDIRDKQEVKKAMFLARPDHVIHLAAESHVCRSITTPELFFQTNVMGTMNMLEAFSELLLSNEDSTRHRFHHVSTDEVFGDLKETDPAFHEFTPYAPRSPYAASKAASDHLVMSWFHTYGLNCTMTNCSNNFGPNQHEEKLIPKAIASIVKQEPMTIYGPGTQVRDWLYVDDHCEAIDAVMHNAASGSRYCIGGSRQMSNLAMVHLIHSMVQEATGRQLKLNVTHTEDRPTDDLRYAVDHSMVTREIGWAPATSDAALQERLRHTIDWYLKRLKEEAI